MGIEKMKAQIEQPLFCSNASIKLSVLGTMPVHMTT